MEKKITASFILEILGRPAEHIKNTLNEITDKINNEKGVKITEKKVHEAKEVKDSKDLYSSFAEIEAEFDAIENLLSVAFTYLPSHLEIISPEEIRMKNIDVSNIITAILLRLHKYDEIVRKVNYDSMVLQDAIMKIAKKHPEIMDMIKPAEKKDNSDNKPEKSKKKSNKES